MTSPSTPEVMVRPPLGGWPKSIRLQEGEWYVKWDGAFHVERWRLDSQPVKAGMLYLTNERLLFKPWFLSWGSPMLVWRFHEIDGFGDARRPWIAFLFGGASWFLPCFCTDANNEKHYFQTTHDEEWLIALADATGLTPRKRNA